MHTIAKTYTVESGQSFGQSCSSAGFGRRLDLGRNWSQIAVQPHLLRCCMFFFTRRVVFGSQLSTFDILYVNSLFISINLQLSGLKSALSGEVSDGGRPFPAA